MTIRKHVKKRPSKRPSLRPKTQRPLVKPQPSSPDISTGLGPAGRDTLAAIAAELAPDIADPLEEALLPGQTPDLDFDQAGETLAAIAQEILADDRDEPARRSTVSYEDRPLSPPSPITQRARMNTLDYSERPTSKRSVKGVGLARWTQGGRSGSAPQPPSAEPLPAGEFEIHEMVTFVVRGDQAQLASATARRDFVKSHLMHRLPVRSMDEVDRIDVTPWTVRGTVIVRVWCRL